VELLIHPECRGQGWGSWLLQTVLNRLQEPVDIWAYGDNPRAVAWLERHGFGSHRLLYSLRREGPPPAPPDWPQGWRVQSYADEHMPAWHELHVRLQRDPARAWTRARLQQQLLQPETPAHRFWLLWQGDDLRGYVWLKGEEIFLLAVDPVCRGGGLGRRLLQFALAQCQHGWGYCDESRPEALRLYRQLGLVEVGRDRCLRLST
jgi:mycothiol synthase